MTVSEPKRDLAPAFAALAHPARIALLRQLRTPRAPGDIEMRDGDGERPLARQTVREHVDKLVAAGLVLPRASATDGRSPQAFVLNHQSLFALAEDLKDLARLRPTIEPDRETVPTRGVVRPRPGGPCLVLVKGIDEGTVFPLAPAKDGSEWILGRKRGIAVPLDHDPYVSAENARVFFADGGFHIEDIPTSRNGTLLNFQPVAPGERPRLESSDVIGLGRTLLVFRSA